MGGNLTMKILKSSSLNFKDNKCKRQVWSSMFCFIQIILLFFSEWRWTVSKLRLEIIKLRLSPHSSLSFLITLWSTTAVILMSMMLNFVLLLMSSTHSSGQLIHNSLLGISLALNGKFQVCSLRTLPAFQAYFQSESGQCYFLKAK